jgi:hypothetical protein
VRSRNHTVIACILILLEVVGALANGVGGSTADRILAVALPAWFILDDVVTALRVTPAAVRITTATGTPSRTLRYVDIDRVSLGATRAGPGGTRTVATLELSPKRGSKLRIVPYRYADFYGPHGWAALLNAAFKNQRVPMDADVAGALAEASSDPTPSGSAGYARVPFH